MKRLFKMSSIVLMSFLLFSCKKNKGEKTKKEDIYYDAIFVDYDDSILYQTKVKDGDIPSYTLTNPTRSNDDNYSYTFSGWSPTIGEIHQNTTYVAQYDKTDLPYTLNFDLDGGTSSRSTNTIKTDKLDKNLFSFDVKKKDYVFVGWSYNKKIVFDYKGNLVNDVTMESSMTFKAIYEEVLIYNNSRTAISGIKDKDITEVTIPNGVTSIGSEAFKDCKYLKEITIPESVTEISNTSFNGCINLASITVDENNTIYDSRDNCNAIIKKDSNELILGCKNTTLVDSITSIGANAFRDNTSIESITILKNITNINDTAFNGCINLASITVDKDNPKYDSRENSNAIIKKDFDELVLGCKNTVIPDGIKIIGSNAFKDITSLKSITFPNGIESIYYKSFENCTSLESIIIPSSVKDIDQTAFRGCINLSSIIIDEENLKYDSRENSNAIIEKENNSLFYGCKNTVIPSSVTSIGGYAFLNCALLESITIPNSITKIDDFTFNGCTSLKTVVLPNSITEIGSRSFEKCRSLESITIPGSVKVIKDGVFDNCTSLKSITLNKGLEYIETHAFINCESLESITIPETVISIEDRLFEGCTSLSSIIVDSNNTIYDSRDNCNAIIKKENNELIFGCKNTVIPNSVTSIGNRAFKSCTTLESIVIPGNVKSIDYDAFGDCISLKSVTLNKGLERINFNAFRGCKSLESIAIPETVISIEGRPFEGCTSLSSIIVDSNNTIYDSRDNCNAIIKKENNELIVGCKATIIPNSVESINYDAYKSCTSLESIIIPKSITEISISMFRFYPNINIFYCGTTSEWESIVLDSNDKCTIYYYSDDKPTIDGNYWHYNNKNEVEVWK